MNDQEFFERLYANPQDNSPELQAALQGNPARETERAQAREFDALLRRELWSVNAPADLKQKLLNPASLGQVPAAQPNRAASLLHWHRLLPVAACLLLAIGLVYFDRSNRNAELTQEILAHVYREEAFLKYQQVLPLQLVNAKMDEAVGAGLVTGKETKDLQVTYADDCWVARHISFHLIMKGSKGAVSIMIIPNSPVASEFDIADERFEGLVTPTSGGNLVVIGEKQEPIREHRNLFTHNLDWEY